MHTLHSYAVSVLQAKKPSINCSLLWPFSFHCFSFPVLWFLLTPFLYHLYIICHLSTKVIHFNNSSVYPPTSLSKGWSLSSAWGAFLPALLLDEKPLKFEGVLWLCDWTSRKEPMSFYDREQEGGAAVFFWVGRTHVMDCSFWIKTAWLQNLVVSLKCSQGVWKL